MGPRGMVVVGVDGMAPSRAALRYALAEGYRRGALVRVVWAYDPGERWATGYGSAMPLTATHPAGELAARARRMLDELVTAAPGLRSVPVQLRMLPGNAAGVLLAASRDAELLVIGHRGRGGLARALLGTVGLHCAMHAGCPVTIVPAGEPDVGSGTGLSKAGVGS
jgi:nucleotide-binding universal stress UspA family protein